MEHVEFYFNSESGKEEFRTYDVETFDDAIGKFHLEFPDEDTRPKVFGLTVKHLNKKAI